MADLRVREATAADWPAIWPIWHRIVAAGDTYTYAPDTGPDEARALWMPGPPAVTLVAETTETTRTAETTGAAEASETTETTVGAETAETDRPDRVDRPDQADHSARSGGADPTDRADPTGPTGGVVVGTALLRPAQPGLGDHVANAGFMVDPDRAGGGIGRALAEVTLLEARRRGYRAMQFNAVVAANTRAVALWRSLGFGIVGTVPEAFRHPTAGLTDLHVMHRRL